MGRDPALVKRPLRSLGHDALPYNATVQVPQADGSRRPRNRRTASRSGPVNGRRLAARASRSRRSVRAACAVATTAGRLGHDVDDLGHGRACSSLAVTMGVTSSDVAGPVRAVRRPAEGRQRCGSNHVELPRPRGTVADPFSGRLLWGAGGDPTRNRGIMSRRPAVRRVSKRPLNCGFVQRQSRPCRWMPPCDAQVVGWNVGCPAVGARRVGRWDRWRA